MTHLIQIILFFIELYLLSLYLSLETTKCRLQCVLFIFIRIKLLF